MQEREAGRQSHKYQRIRTKTHQNLTGSEEFATESQMEVFVATPWALWLPSRIRRAPRSGT